MESPAYFAETPKWQIIDEIRWRVRTGAPWRDVPVEYAPSPTLSRWVRRWQRNGTWPAVLAVPQAHADAARKISWMVSVDSTISRAHQHAAGARRDGGGQKEPPGWVASEPDDHGLGCSRGGWTTKTHLGRVRSRP
jgi:transposase